MQYLKDEIRQRILSSAVEEFKQYGFSDASIRNIANNAEISLGNVYRYFSNKESLYFAVINPFMKSIEEAVESVFVFAGRSMKEVSELLVNFLMQYSDELIIVRKGNTSHYEAFVNYMVSMISRKVREMITSEFPEIDEKIQNPDFYNMIAESFLMALFRIFKAGEDSAVQERNVRELITFFFGHMKDRFYHFDLEIN